MTANRKGLAALVLAALGVAVLTGALMAHGIGKAQVLNEPAGPYLLSAWTDPNPLREDETHVVVAVTDPTTREPIVTGVQVEVRATSLAEPSEVVSVLAGTDNVNQLFYAAEFNDRLTAGQWRITIHIQGEQGSGEIEGFVIEVEPARGLNWLLLGAAGIGLIVVIWLVGSLRPERPDRMPRQKSSTSA